MASVVKCEGCGAVVPYKKAVHIRCYDMTSATSYKSSCAKEVTDVCQVCYKKFLQQFKREAE